MFYLPYDTENKRLKSFNLMLIFLYKYECIRGVVKGSEGLGIINMLQHFQLFMMWMATQTRKQSDLFLFAKSAALLFMFSSFPLVTPSDLPTGL